MRRSGVPRRSAACRARAFRPTSPPSSRTTTRAWGMPTLSREAWRPRSTSTTRRSPWDPRFTTCGTSWGACCSKRDARWTHGSTSRSSSGRVPTTWTPRRCWGSPAISRATGSRPRPCGKTAASAGPKIPAWKPTSPCWPATTTPPSPRCWPARRRRRTPSRRPPDPETAAPREPGGGGGGGAARGLAGLRAVAPTRPLGRYARLAALDAADRGDTAGAMALLPGAAAAAGDPRMTDSLLFVYGMAAVRARACSTAVSVFEGIIRRQREPAVADGAREGLGLCALVEGQRLVAAGKPTEAEDWFRRAAAPRGPAVVVRGAFLGLGDVKLAQGDVAGAPECYPQVLSGGTPGDTLTQRAQDKINALGKADAPSPAPPKQP